MAQGSELLAVLGLGVHVVKAGEQESPGAARWVAHRFADLGIDAFDDGFDHRARSEILPGTGLHLGGVALQEPS